MVNILHKMRETKLKGFSSRITNLNWIASIFLPLMVILMEVLWVYPWLNWVGKWQSFDWQRTPLSLISIFIILGISFIITRFQSIQRPVVLWIKLGLLLVIIFIIVRFEYNAGIDLLSGQWFSYFAQLIIDSFTHPHPIVLALIVSVYLCWRGIRLGNSPLLFDDVYRYFLVGLIALVLLVIVWAATMGLGSLGNLATTVGLQVTGFFFFGLTALALGNLKVVQRRLRREEMTPLSNRRWIGILLSVVVGIVLLSIGISSIFSPGIVAVIMQVFDFVFNIFSHILYYIYIPISYLVEGIYYIIMFIINLIRGRNPLKFEIPEFFEPEELPEALARQAGGIDIVLILKWLFLVIIIAAIIYLLARAISRFRSFQEEGEVEEVSESLWSWKGFRSDLRLFLSMLFNRWRLKRMQKTSDSLVPSWYLEDDAKNILDVREIYRRLLWSASHSGIKHRNHETPYEYSRRLSRTVPDSSEQLGELTNLYVNVRYGEIEVKNEKLEYANVLWRVLHRLLRRPEKDNPGK
jgi:hypothetical protein